MIFRHESEVAKGTDALLADVLTLVGHKVMVAAAENTSRLVFTQDNTVPFQVNFQRITLLDVQVSAQFDGQDNPTQFIHPTDDSCSLRSISFSFSAAHPKAPLVRGAVTVGD
jgi:hypothetical protein